MDNIRRSNRTLTVDKTLRSEATAGTEIGVDAFAALEEEPAVPNIGGHNCEIHMYECRYNSRGERVFLQSGCRSELDEEPEDSIDAALVLTRYYSEDKKLDETTLDIRSPYIKAALEQVIGSYPGVNIHTDGPILINDDPWCLFHYRNELRGYAAKLRNKKAKEHIHFVLQYMAKVLRREIANYESLMVNNDREPGLEFQNLWMAFKPGILLYKKSGDSKDIDMICRFREMEIKKDSDTSPSYWRLKVEMLAWVGEELKYVLGRFHINKYDGYRPLTALDLYPLAYHPDTELVQRRVLARGKKYVTMFGVHHCFHDGIASLVAFAGPQLKLISFMARGRVMVDRAEFNNDVRFVIPEIVPDSKIIDPLLGEHLTLSEEELLICEYNIPAFTLSTKRWGLFNVSNLDRVEYNHDAFSRLILPSGVKKMLSALVHLQEGETSQFDDLIVGKGKGLIILLHGLPGVGKTFTAESIADFSKRPLYTIGKSDFGHTAFQDSEIRLTAALARAAKWKAIVLLDEADVFMQERGANEMFRNEQVSVLLRILEYFEGTMFLTTNRVQTIDPAFKSRIHLSLTYPALSSESRSELWETFILKGTEENSRPKWLTARFLDKISKEEVNGREIKNIVRVAHALAFNDKRSMKATDILQGLQSLRTFERDFSEAAAAKRKQDYEHFEPSKKVKIGDRIEDEERKDPTELANEGRPWWKFW
ncbi:P-loop containing nucleoside triphosphate hydrolase [Glarea lozoyensis ATCC 20868]|uniref:p-loop containing nucleoside triphosphate hydrolase n=1 Tax=Glarea lozoyensis (strain ATCC 20868 / MF5171) TaxID=1116229 RepID=S3D9P8_GLAL2|nr:P-loop containing nucleoside triphosphate hydrolase [Glarea lozoyensis ATCC 20868]EPE28706.1 P-loop containing nucleoside triphosphate hydrolase [Glarea lozoyensis ATCC 20868]